VNNRYRSVQVHIPTPLRSYTGQTASVEADGATVGALLSDLDRRYPGIRFRVVDEHERLRRHVKVFVNEESVRDLDTPIDPTDDVVIMQALSGG
jgi:molybdopterin converting factor small subunit